MNVVRAVGPPDLSLLRTISNVKPSTAEADVLDALIVALTLLKDRLKCERRIFLLTDGSSKTFDTEQFDDIVGMFGQLDCKLDVMYVATVASNGVLQLLQQLFVFRDFSEVASSFDSLQQQWLQ